MASFTTRIELHNAKTDDYEALHEQMKAQGFKRTIKSDAGIYFHLPTAEYDIAGNLTSDQVVSRAQDAATRTGKNFWLLVTESVSRSWILSTV